MEKETEDKKKEESTKIVWAQLRFSKNEYHNLKTVRIFSEMKSDRRITIRGLFRLLIEDAVEDLKSEKLHLPFQRMPELPHDDVFEYYALPLKENEAKQIDQIIEKLKLTYKRADVIRRLIERKHQQYIEMASNKPGQVDSVNSDTNGDIKDIKQ